MEANRPPEQWERDAPHISKSHLWPSPFVHFFCIAVVIGNPVFVWFEMGDELARYLSGAGPRLSDLDIGWERDTRSWVYLICSIVAWPICLFGFLLQPVHMAIDRKSIYWTSILRFESKVPIGHVKDVKVGSSRQKELLINVQNKRRSIVVNKRWPGAQVFVSALYTARPDVFPADFNTNANNWL